MDKYFARSRDEHTSSYHFGSKNGKVPVISGGATHATWPLNEDYCRTMLLLHWPNWCNIQEVKEDSESWIERFTDFISSNECTGFVKTQVANAKRYAEHLQEPVFDSL